MELRPYEPGDEQAIFNLFQLAFRKTLAYPEWRWRYLENPTKEILVYLMWDSDKLVGHYAVSPLRMSIASVAKMTALSLDTMTHPEYSGRGIFTTLAEATYQEMTRRGYLAVWGFPNTASHYGFRKNMGWKEISTVPMLRLDLTQSRMREEETGRIVNIKEFDSRFDKLWNRLQPGILCGVVRDASFLNWRYFTNPSNHYHVLAYEDDNHIQGYAVSKLYQDGSSLFIDLVDLLAVPEVLPNILTAIIQHAQREKAFGINTWLNVHHPFYLTLERIGFAASAPVTYLGARLLSDSQVYSQFMDYRTWYLTMGDSDVF